MNPLTPKNIPVIYRDIASIIIFSNDGKVLMGRKDSKGGGVYSDSWHLPGGGADDGETLPEAASRELNEEVVGLNIEDHELEAAPGLKGSGATTKTLRDGTRVWCEMAFNYFRVVRSWPAQELLETLRPGSDFVELKFFTPQELSRLPTIPGGIEDKIIAGALTATSVLAKQ